MALSEWSPIPEVYNPLKAGSIDGTTDTEPHDRAVIRAMNAKYKANKSVDGDPKKTIFIARLNRDTEEDTLWTAFRKFGRIKKCRLVRDIVAGFSKGFGFIEYEEEKVARAAGKYGNKMVIDKAEVFVDMECERVLPGWVPRRLGGGVGGNKKSGQLRFGGKDRPFITPILQVTREKGRETKQEPTGDRYNRVERGGRNWGDRDQNRRRESGYIDKERRNSRDNRTRDKDYGRGDDEYRSRDRRYRERSRSQDRDRKKYSRRRSVSYSPEPDRGWQSQNSSTDYSQVLYMEQQRRKIVPDTSQKERTKPSRDIDRDQESGPVNVALLDNTQDVKVEECVRTGSKLENTIIKMEPGSL